MYFQEDYILRQIEMLGVAIARLFFHKNTMLYDLPEKNQQTLTDDLCRRLHELIAEGKINEAENLLYENLDAGAIPLLEIAVDFYGRLNQLDDAYLISHNFSREEIEDGLREVARIYHISLDDIT